VYYLHTLNHSKFLIFYTGSLGRANIGTTFTTSNSLTHSHALLPSEIYIELG
jgi:hypothetical protein